MVDRDRVLAKIDALDGYLKELEQVVPGSFAEYLRNNEKRRACERLLQISTEAVLDICHLLVTGLRLGLPGEEDDVFEKLDQSKLLSSELIAKLRSIKGFRNILVHEYGGIDDSIVYKIATGHVDDFKDFRREVLAFLKQEHGN